MNATIQSGALPVARPIDETSHSLPAEGISRRGLVESGPLVWICLSAAIAFAAISLFPLLMTLWEIWTTDPLRSIGMLIVPVAVLLTLREWRLSGWELQGTWWGLVLLILASLTVVQPQFLLLSWKFSLSFRVNLLPEALPLYLYGSGVILLFAGPRVWRRAWFPLGLLLFAQPVPHGFVYLLDHPLQSFSARTARAFATMIGFPPTNSEALKLMFTPTFGMFIAPGCDGIRGSVGLGYAALIVGYLKRVSLGRWLLYVCSGVLLGHLFN